MHFSEGVGRRRIGLKWDVVKSSLPSNKQEFWDKPKEIIVFPYVKYGYRKKMLCKMKKYNSSIVRL